MVHISTRLQHLHHCNVFVVPTFAKVKNNEAKFSQSELRTFKNKRLCIDDNPVNQNKSNFYRGSCNVIKLLTGQCGHISVTLSLAIATGPLH